MTGGRNDCRVCGSPMVPHGQGEWCSVWGHHREADPNTEMDMFGQKFDDVRRMVLLVEVDGRQYGWEILPPNSASWSMTGLRKGSTEATITATGEFHRLTREAPMPEEDEPTELQP